MANYPIYMVIFTSITLYMVASCLRERVYFNKQKARIFEKRPSKLGY